jgi:hypothetical protein
MNKWSQTWRQKRVKYSSSVSESTSAAESERREGTLGGIFYEFEVHLQLEGCDDLINWY